MFNAEWNTTFIIAQVIAGLAGVFAIISITQKNKKNLLIFNLLAQVIFLAYYALLGAWTGMAINVVCAIRTFMYYFENNKFCRSVYLLLFFEVACIVSAIFTWAGLISLLPLFAVLIVNYALWNKKLTNILFFLLTASALWLPYNLLVNAYIALIIEIFYFVSTFVMFIIRLKQKTAKEITSSHHHNLKV